MAKRKIPVRKRQKDALNRFLYWHQIARYYKSLGRDDLFAGSASRSRMGFLSLMMLEAERSRNQSLMVSFRGKDMDL